MIGPPSPGWSRVKDPKTWPKLQPVRPGRAYAVQGRSTSADMGLVQRAYKWHRESDPAAADESRRFGAAVNPSQPLTVGVWNDNRKLNDLAVNRSDVITFHRYSTQSNLRTSSVLSKSMAVPWYATEWLKRDWGSVADQLPVFAHHRVGCLHWGLVNGKTQTQYPWGSKASAPEPKVWQHDLFRKDRTPYDPPRDRTVQAGHRPEPAGNTTNSEQE